jgi:phage-related protein
MVALATAFIRLRPDPDRAAFIVAGARMGDAAGDAAGKSMGTRAVQQARAGLIRGGADMVKDGETIGDKVGAGISRGAGRSSRKAAGDTSAFGNAIALTAARATLLGTSVAAALPSVLHLTAALAPAAGAVTVLPAAFLASRVAMGTFKVAVSGVGEAISAGLTGTAAEAKKAMDGLPPAAQRFTASIVTLKPRLDALRASVAQGFFLPLQNEIRPLADRYFPLLTREMSNLAGPLGGLGEQIAQSARQAGVFSAVTAIFRNTRLSVINLRESIAPLVQAFAALINSTAGQLPGLAQGFTNLAVRVAGFVTAAAQSGRISAAFQAAMVTLRDLGGIAVNVGSILGSVFRAASVGSGSLLGNLRALTGQVAAFLRSAQGGDALTSVFSTLATLGNALRTSLAAVLPAVARSLAIIGPVLAGLAGPASQLVVALAPLLPYFTSLTAIVLRSLTPAIAALAGWLARNETVIKVLGTAVAGIVVGMRAYGAGVAIATVATQVWEVATKAATLTMRIWNSTFVLRLRIWAIDAAASVQSTAATVANTVATRASAAATVAWSAIQRAAAVASVGLSIAMRAAGVALRFMLGPVGLVITAIGLLAAALTYLFNHNKTFHDGVIAMWNGIQRAIGAVSSWFTGKIIPSIRTAINQGIAGWNALQKAVASVWAGIQRAIGAVSSWFTGTIVPSVRTAINQGATAFRLLQSVNQAVWIAIRVYVQTWWNVVRAIFVTVRSWLAIVGTAFRTFASIGGIAIRTLGAGIAAVWNSIRTGSFAPLRTFISATLPGAFRAGVGAITAAWNRVREAARVPVAFVVNRVINPLINGWNSIAGVFGAPKAGTIRGFAEGGRIPGRASATDNLLATMTDARGMALSPLKVATGEYVVNADATQRWLPVLESINNSGRGRNLPGGVLPGFADGGLIGWARSLAGKAASVTSNIFKAISDPSGTIKRIADAAINAIPGGGFLRTALVGGGRRLLSAVIEKIKGLVSLTGGGGAAGIGGNASPGFPPWPSSPSAQRGDSGVWRNVVALIRSTGPVSGSFGNSYRGGDPLWHGSGRAVDWMGFNQDALATFLASRRPLELIHRTNRRDYAYTRGRNKGSFNNALMQAHRNHIHIAMAEGGLLSRATGMPLRLFDSGGAWPTGTLGANLSGRTEYVSTDASTERSIEIHIHNSGVIGSQSDLDLWLEKGVKRLRKQRRLP